MDRESFLTRVREAATRGRAFRIHSAPVAQPSRVGYVGGGDDLPARLAEEVTAVGGMARVVADLGAARAEFVELLKLYVPRSALCWRHPLLETLGLDAALAEAGIEKLDFDSLAKLDEIARRERVFAAEIGVSSVTWAIAESGSLALASRPGQERSASLLPPVHVALVGASQIVPDLFDLFDRAPLSDLDSIPSSLTLITGPSKTGDLEMTLTTGVHGPGKWHVIIVRNV